MSLGVKVNHTHRMRLDRRNPWNNVGRRECLLSYCRPRQTDRVVRLLFEVLRNNEDVFLLFCLTVSSPPRRPAVKDKRCTSSVWQEPVISRDGCCQTFPCTVFQLHVSLLIMSVTFLGGEGEECLKSLIKTLTWTQQYGTDIPVTMPLLCLCYIQWNAMAHNFTLCLQSFMPLLPVVAYLSCQHLKCEMLQYNW